MRGVYNVHQLGVTSGTSVVTLVEIENPATNNAEVLYAYIDNEDSETSAQWAVSWVRKSVDGTNVTTPTVSSMDSSQASHGLTVRGMCTSVGTISETIMRRGFNVLNGWEWVPTTEYDRIWIPPSGVLGLHLPVAPPGSVTLSCGVLLAVHG